MILCNCRKGISAIRLIVVLVVIFAIGIPITLALVAVVQTNVARARHDANETGAEAMLRTFRATVESYHEAHPSDAYPTFDRLTNAHPPRLVNVNMQGIGPTATIERAGYRFRFVDPPTVNRYCIDAVPLELGVTGSRVFSIDASGAFATTGCERAAQGKEWTGWQ